MSNTKKINSSNTKQEPVKEKKTFTVFGKIGYGLSLAGLICCWFPFVDLCLAIPGLVFSAMAKNHATTNLEQHQKSFKMGLAGTIVGGIMTLILFPAILGIVLGFCVK